MLEGGHRRRAVGVIRRRHQHQVDVVALHHLLVAGNHRGIRGQLRPHLLRGAVRRIVERSDACPARGLQLLQNAPTAPTRSSRTGSTVEPSVRRIPHQVESPLSAPSATRSRRRTP